MPFEGLVRTSEKVYDLLTLGKSLEQTIDGDTKGFTLRYIDWQNPRNNVFHVTAEFEVERTGSHETRRPDIVCSSTASRSWSSSASGRRRRIRWSGHQAVIRN